MQKLLVFIMAILFMISCQKDENNDSPESKANHWPLAIGNYWVYQHVYVDYSGKEVIHSKLDSIYINRDTIIRGNTYFIIEGVYEPFFDGKTGIVHIVRDSSNCIVNSTGRVLLAENNYNDVLYNFPGIDPLTKDTLYYMSAKMEKVSNPITVPAGTFEVINKRETLSIRIDITGIDNPRYADNYYANNVGQIIKTFYYLNYPEPMQKRLLRYHISK